MSCPPHKRTELMVTGGMHFAAGDVWDDIREEVICLDCGQIVDEPRQGGEHARRQGKYLLWRNRRSRAPVGTWRAGKYRLGSSLKRLEALDTADTRRSVSDGHRDGLR